MAKVYGIDGGKAKVFVIDDAMAKVFVIGCIVDLCGLFYCMLITPLVYKNYSSD